MTFTTSEESFELIVIFFRLTNFPITFQIIINTILQNSVNIRKVANFIDNVIMGMEEEKEHDEVVEEVVKKLVKNYLYIKPEKSK